MACWLFLGDDYAYLFMLPVIAAVFFTVKTIWQRLTQTHCRRRIGWQAIFLSVPPPRPCTPSFLKEKLQTPTPRSSVCHSSRSAEGWTLQRKPQAWAKASPATAAARHGPGPGVNRSRSASVDDRRPAEELQDAGPLHRAPGSRPRRSGQVLPGARMVRLQVTASAPHEIGLLAS